MARTEDASLNCAVEGCVRGVYNLANGWCNMHYVRYWRTGTVDEKPKPLRGDLSYAGAHQRVRRELGKASDNPCVKCGCQATDWAYDRTDPDECVGYQSYARKCVYSQWPEFYMPLCRGCHMALDGGAAAEGRTHCPNGHKYGEGDYRMIGGEKVRACMTCYTATQNRYRESKGLNPIGYERPSALGVRNVYSTTSGKFRAVVNRDGKRMTGPSRATIDEAIADRDLFTEKTKPRKRRTRKKK